MTNKDSQAFQEENRIGCFIVILEIFAFSYSTAGTISILKKKQQVIQWLTLPARPTDDLMQ